MRTPKGHLQKKESNRAHPGHSKELVRLNRIEGQLDGVRKMIVEQRYCPEIIQQIRATRSAILALEGALLEVHLRSCVTDAMRTKGALERDLKIRELIHVFIQAEKQGVGP